MSELVPEAIETKPTPIEEGSSTESLRLQTFKESSVSRSEVNPFSSTKSANEEMQKLLHKSEDDAFLNGIERKF